MALLASCTMWKWSTTRVACGSALAAVAWCGLSRACQYHAYELGPTVGEVEHLIGQVEALIIETRLHRHIAEVSQRAGPRVGSSAVVA
jgi:hypothetical protein